MTSAAQRRRDVGNVLRHLNHPKRICSLQVVSAYFDPAQRLGNGGGARALERIRKVIASALLDLTARQRVIVERCDLAGEMHKWVLRDVGLSERQFYRERGAALDKIDRALRNLASEITERAEVSIDHTSAGLTLANVLFQAGRGRDATRLLERLGASIDEASTKSWVFSRLTELYARLSLSREAAIFADNARRLATESGCAWVEAEAAANAAYALRYSGQERQAVNIALQVLPRLRSPTEDAPTWRRAEALGVATGLIAERAMENGNANTARDACKVVQALIDGAPFVRPAVRCGVRYWHSICTFFTPGEEANGVDEMEMLLRDALDAGYTVEAGSISNVLSHYYRELGKPDRALQLALRMQSMIIAVCPDEVVSVALLEKSAAQMDLGQLSELYADIESARHSLVPGTLIFADTFLSEAKAAMLDNNPLRALKAAHRAIELFTILDRPRIVGHALRYQALALAALGKRDSALSVMAECLERLDAYGHEIYTARVHEEAARLSRDPRKIRAARRRVAAVAAVAK